MKYLVVVCLSCIAFSIFTLLVSAQSGTESRAGKPVEQETLQADAEQEENIIVCRYDLAVLPIVARHQDGTYIRDLNHQEITVYEDGVEQVIAFFSEVEGPFHVILLLDAGVSVERQREIQSDALAFIAQVQLTERVKIISFSDEVRELCDFTSDQDKLFRAVYRMQPGSGAKLYDAIGRALADLQPITTGPKAIILFTNGADDGSETATRDSILRQVERSGAIIYPIRYETRGETGRTTNRYLKKMAARSGGKVYRADRPGPLSVTLADIAAQLRAQYLVGYHPINNKFDGSYRKVKVRTAREGIVLRTRSGYRAPSIE